MTQEDLLNDVISLLNKDCCLMTALDEDGFSPVDYAQIYHPDFGNKLVETIGAFAQRGYASAENVMGMIFHTGLNCPQNSETAFKAFSSAALKQDPQAIYAMGMCHLNGWGTPVNINWGLKLITSAANFGVTRAETALGQIALAQPEPDFKTAQDWLDRAQQKGHATAFFLSQGIPIQGLSPVQQQINKEFFNTRAAVQGHKEAQWNMSEIYLEKTKQLLLQNSTIALESTNEYNAAVYWSSQFHRVPSDQASALINLLLREENTSLG